MIRTYSFLIAASLFSFMVISLPPYAWADWATSGGSKMSPVWNGWWDNSGVGLYPQRQHPGQSRAWPPVQPGYVNECSHKIGGSPCVPPPGQYPGVKDSTDPNASRDAASAGATCSGNASTNLKVQHHNVCCVPVYEFFNYPSGSKWVLAGSSNCAYPYPVPQARPQMDEMSDRLALLFVPVGLGIMWLMKRRYPAS